MRRLRAILWDVDGTLAETERDGHRVAFNAAFAAAGLSWHWDETRYGELLDITGGRERLLHDMARRPDAPADAAERERLARHLHASKNGYYAALVRDRGIPLREGVRSVIEAGLERGLAMGIVTTTSRGNLDALLEAVLGAEWGSRFAVVVCGEDVSRKKPDPQAYELALRRLDVSAAEVLAIEDAPNGVEAARAAGCPVIVTRSVYFAQAVIEGACAVGPGLHTRDGWRPAARSMQAGPIDVSDLEHWWAQGAPTGAQTPLE